MFFTALHLGPAALYKQKLQSGELNEDNNQLMVINRLDELAEEAGDYELTKPSVLSKVSECYLTIHRNLFVSPLCQEMVAEKCSAARPITVCEIRYPKMTTILLNYSSCCSSSENITVMITSIITYPKPES